MQRFMETHDLVKKGMEIKREDVREGLTAVLADLHALRAAVSGADQVAGVKQ